MTVKRIAAVPAIAAALVGIAVTMPVPAEARDCKPDVTVGATNQFLARAKWRTVVRRRYGVAYIFWSRADRKTERCTAGGCTASAAPCR